MDQLPPDVIYRIADRLPIRCLAKFRCASKGWYTDPFLKSCMAKFVEKATIVALQDSRRDGPNNMTRKPVFEVDIDRNLVKAWIPRLFDFPCKEPRLIGTCNGLIGFFESESPQRLLVLVNPVLEEVLSISTLAPPDPRRVPIWSAAGLGLNHASGVYKLVLCSFRKILLFEFDTRSWWEISWLDEWFDPLGVGIFVGGTLCWQRYRHPSDIVSFDVAGENVSLLPCPISCNALFNLGDHLGASTYDLRPGGHYDIWEFNIHNKEWTNKYKIDQPLLLELASSLEDDFITIVGTQNEMILFQFTETIYSYDPRSRKFERVHPGTATQFYSIHGEPDFYCVRGSLESLSRLKCINDEYEMYKLYE